MIDNPESPMQIQSFSLRPDDMIEITYVERRDQGKTVGLIKTIVFDPVILHEHELEATMDTIMDWVDAGLLQLRQEAE